MEVKIVRPWLYCLTGLFLFSAGLHGQNLVTNGDFQANNTNGWTFSGFTVKPQILNYNTSGTGASLSFSNRPGSKPSTWPPGGSYSMEQKVLLLQGVEHLLTADIAVANTLPLVNIDAGNIEFWGDGKLLKRVKFGRALQRQVHRRQVCIRFTPAMSGQKVFKVVFSRAWGAQLGTPRHHIDNIVMLRPARKPIICARGERKIGGNLEIEVIGTSRAAFVVFFAGSKAKALTIPGFSGSWFLPLPPQSQPILFGVFDQAGRLKVQVPLTASNAGAVAGLPLFWQGIEVTSTSLSLGTLSTFGVYR